jgi:hypothetical protein
VESELNWQLNNNATTEEFESWEHHMLQGFYRCATYDHNLDDSTRFSLAVRRVDVKLKNWWYQAMWEMSITSTTCANFRKFLQECFIPSSTVVPFPTSMVIVEVNKQPPKVIHRLEDVGQSIPALPKAATTGTTHSHEKLATAKILAPGSTSREVQYVEHVQPVVPMQQVNKAAATISEVKKADVVMANVSKDVVEEGEPLNGLNMQLKRVYGNACMPVDRGQRWSLFQM